MVAGAVGGDDEWEAGEGGIGVGDLEEAGEGHRAYALGKTQTQRINAPCRRRRRSGAGSEDLEAEASEGHCFGVRMKTGSPILRKGAWRQGRVWWWRSSGLGFGGRSRIRGSYARV